MTESRIPSIVVAMDFDNAEACLALARQLSPALCRVKVGKELFTACGPAIVEQLMALGFEVFLDLKFHDIPNTTAKAVHAAANLGVWMLNVHASGGERMMLAAVGALDKFKAPPLLIAVTVLTSLEAQDLQAVGIAASPEEQVLNLATLAQSCGLDGVVCSAQEASLLQKTCGPNFQLVTPGIRLPSSKADDQRRTLTPKLAMQAGSHHLVIGRPITQAQKPAAACRRFFDSLREN